MAKQETKFEEISRIIKTDFSILSEKAQARLILLLQSSMEDAYNRGVEVGVEKGRNIELMANPELSKGLVISGQMELSVCGYTTQFHREIKGKLSEVVDKFSKISNDHWDAVMENYEKHGDHRGYCPEFANGYPSESPEDGEAVNSSLIDLKMWYDGQPVEINPTLRNAMSRFLDAIRNGELKDLNSKIISFEKKLTQEITSEEKKVSFKR